MSVAEHQVSQDLPLLLWHRRWFIAMVALGAGLLAGLGSFAMTRTYRSQVQLAVTTEDGMSEMGRLTRQVPIAALAGFLGNLRGNNREEALAYIKSRQFSVAFIEENGLMPTLFPGRWDRKRGAWKDPEDAPTSWEAYRVFDEEVRRVTEDRVTGIVTVAFDWPDPDEARKLVNRYVKKADDDLRAKEIEEADRSLKYLHKELETTFVVGLQQALYELVEEQTKRAMIARVRDHFVFKVIDPGVAPDIDDPVSPKRLGLAIVGMLFGIVVAVCWVAYRGLNALGRVQRQPEDAPAP